MPAAGLAQCCGSEVKARSLVGMQGRWPWQELGDHGGAVIW